MKRNKLIKNLVLTYSIILGGSALFIAVITANDDSGFGFVVALILGFLGIPFFLLLTGVGFFLAGRNKEGGVLTISALVFALIGLSICGGGWF